MVLTKSELMSALQDEVRILLHLAGKIDRATLDYRPTPKPAKHARLAPVPDHHGARPGAGDQGRRVRPGGVDGSRGIRYLKACGREELGTMNLWAGVDAPPAA